MPDANNSLVARLLKRRVPQIFAIYMGACWGLVEFADFMVGEFLLSPHWTRVALVGSLLLAPSALMLAWYHGKPGRDRMAKAEKVGIPANVALCVAVLWGSFGGSDLGAATTAVTVETEDGEVIERVVAKAEFRKRTALFPLDAGTGIASPVGNVDEDVNQFGVDEDAPTGLASLVRVSPRRTVPVVVPHVYKE